MNGMKVIALFTVSLMMFTAFLSQAHALLNPSTVYCEKLGFRYETRMTSYGEQGICILPDNSSIDAWDFLTGKLGNEFSYCKRMGYTIKVVTDPDKCGALLLDECAVCVLPGGQEKEVSALMDLDLSETKCGDTVCGIPENHNSCPQDCKFGGWDGLCENGDDGICDIDCWTADKDCKGLISDLNETNKTGPAEPVCGDKICEAPESEASCPSDCKAAQPPAAESCGDGRCGPGENSRSCASDCPSGGEDNYCDREADGVCDPDCQPSQDEDCAAPGGGGGAVKFIFVGIILIIIVAVIIIFIKRRPITKAQ